jgi:hypothetical protein
MYQKCTKIKNVAPSTVAMLHKKSSSKKKKKLKFFAECQGGGALGKEIKKIGKKSLPSA